MKSWEAREWLHRRCITCKLLCIVTQVVEAWRIDPEVSIAEVARDSSWTFHADLVRTVVMLQVQVVAHPLPIRHDLNDSKLVWLKFSCGRKRVN